MGEFYESIRDELDKLEAQGSGGGSGGGSGARNSLAPTARAAKFGADYNSDTTVVRQVQTAINALGYTDSSGAPLSVDGAFGPATQAGVEWFQGQNGLAQDGIIGDQTLGALGITPPGGTSVQSVVGTAKGAVAAIQSQFSTLIDWAQSNPQPLTQGRGIAPGLTATRASVVNSFVDWTKPLEGWVPWMYLDELGYVTTGLGDLIDSPGAAQGLAWKKPDGSTASSDEVASEWNAVDAHRTAAKGQQQGLPGGGAQGGWSTLRISAADIQGRVSQQLASNESHILSAMPGFASMPADAQLGVHSMAWAMGPGHFSTDFAHFTSALNSGDYATAAAQSKMQGTGIDRRNDANKLLFTNAAQVAAKKKDPDTLYYISGLQALYGGMSKLQVAGIALGVAGGIGGLLYALTRKG